VPRKYGKTGKSNFVETRTFWHIFRSFDRMWTFFILGLQVFNSTKENVYAFIFPLIMVMIRLEHSYLIQPKKMFMPLFSPLLWL